MKMSDVEEEEDGAEPPASSRVSMKRDRSKGGPPDLSEEPEPSDSKSERGQTLTSSARLKRFSCRSLMYSDFTLLFQQAGPFSERFPVSTMMNLRTNAKRMKVRLKLATSLFVRLHVGTNKVDEPQPGGTILEDISITHFCTILQNKPQQQSHSPPTHPPGLLVGVMDFLEIYFYPNH